MNNYPPNPASRRPEGTWGQDDEDFRIVPPPGAVSAPPPTSSAPPPATWAPTPAPVPAPPPTPRPAPVAAPLPARAPAKPAAPDRQKLYMALGAGAVILAAILFFIIVLFWPTSNDAVPEVLQKNNWAKCEALSNTAPDDVTAKDLLFQARVACGRHFAEPAARNVVAAMGHFTQALQLKSDDEQTKLQIAWAITYTAALKADQEGNRGAFIGHLTTLNQQATPYNDTAQDLYRAWLDSGKDAYELWACDEATRRFTNARNVQFVEDKSQADQWLANTQKRLQENPKNCKQWTGP